MENSHAAFLAGEYALIRGESELLAVQQKHVPSPQQVLGLHTVMPTNMGDYAGQRVRIKSVSYYHFGWVLYEFDGLPGHWPEETVMDQQFAEDDDPFNQPANLTYIAVPSKNNEFAEIRHLDGRLFCTLRAHDVDTLVTDINRVAKLRSRPSFAFRYNFDGVEYFDSIEPHPDRRITNG